MNKLQILLKEIDIKYDINHGGCAFIASVLAEKFEANSEEYQVCCDMGVCQLKQNEDERLKKIICVKDKVKSIDCRLYCGWWTPRHLFIKSNGIEYNKWKTVKYDILDLTSKQLKEIYEKGRWNNKFDKNKINEIRKLILEC